MKLTSRVSIITLILVACLVLQGVLLAHLRVAHKVQPGELARPIQEFPRELGSWISQDRPIDEKLLYADAHLQRTFFHPQRGQALLLWMVYSSVGEDRGHHPEVCFAVAGKPEDQSARKTFDVPGHDAPVQQFRFGYPGQYQLVYYWHYTLPSADVNDLDRWQQLYHRSRKRPASITIEVFAPQSSESDEESAQEFVKLVDAALQDFVGQDAQRGSRRLPVTILEGTPPEVAN